MTKVNPFKKCANSSIQFPSRPMSNVHKKSSYWSKLSLYLVYYGPILYLCPQFTQKTRNYHIGPNSHCTNANLIWLDPISLSIIHPKNKKSPYSAKLPLYNYLVCYGSILLFLYPCPQFTQRTRNHHIGANSHYMTASLLWLDLQHCPQFIQKTIESPVQRYYKLLFLALVNKT